MKLITKQMLVERAAFRWKSAYYRNGSWVSILTHRTDEVYEKLLSATTEEEVVRIIGNSSWTRNICQECGKDSSRLVELGAYEYSDKTFSVCEDCLKQAVELCKKENEMTPGLGVLINALFGGDSDETREALKKSYGQTIESIALLDEGDGELIITFSSGDKLRVFDDGRSCCESRYITCDDALSDFVGATLLEMGIQDGPEVESTWGYHEQQFLIVKTSKGHFTVCTHNEHNGYYGGFWLKAVFSKGVRID